MGEEGAATGGAVATGAGVAVAGAGGTGAGVGAGFFLKKLNMEAFLESRIL
jgi:hypothetical protein